MKEAFEPKNKIKASIMVTEIWDNMKGATKPIILSASRKTFRLSWRYKKQQRQINIL